MDATQTLNQNLAPMLDAIRSYGQQIAEERKLEEQRSYNRSLVADERAYLKRVKDDERTYQEQMDLKRRNNAFDDEAKKRRIEISRTIQRAFPGEDVSKLSDSQLEARAYQATEKLTRDDVFSKSENEIRAKAITMGIKDADKADIATLREAVATQASKEAIAADQSKLKAAEEYQTNRLTTPDGQNALEAYKKIGTKKAELLRQMATTMSAPDDHPIDNKAVGARMVEMMSNPDMTASPDDAEIGPKLYAVLTDPRNKNLAATVLNPILAGQRPSPQAIASIPGLTPRDQAYLIGLNARAIHDITMQDPKSKMADAALGRNSLYGEKYYIGESLRQLDAEANRLASEYPALRKMPSVHMDTLLNPTKPAPPGGGPSLPGLPGVPGGSQNQPVVPGAPAVDGQPQASVDAQGQPDRVTGLFPAIGSYLSGAGGAMPNMPVFNEGLNEFGTNAGSLAGGVVNTVRAVPPLLFGGNMPPAPETFDPVQMMGGGMKMAMAPFEAPAGVLKYTADSMRSVPGADQPIRPMAGNEDPDAYKAYLRMLMSQQYNPNRFF